MKKLYFVGTSHIDPKGPERLEKFLNFVRPDIIGIEASDESVDPFLNNRNGFFQNLLMFFIPSNLKKYLTTIQGYEILVPYEYQKKQNPSVKIYNLEDEETRKKFNETWEKNYKKKEKSSVKSPLLNSDLEDYIKKSDQIYDDKERYKIPEKLNVAIIERDMIVAEKIRTIFPQTFNTMVYVGGVAHFFGEYENIFEQLKDF